MLIFDNFDHRTVLLSISMCSIYCIVSKLPKIAKLTNIWLSRGHHTMTSLIDVTLMSKLDIYETKLPTSKYVARMSDTDVSKWYIPNQCSDVHRTVLFTSDFTISKWYLNDHSSDVPRPSLGHQDQMSDTDLSGPTFWCPQDIRWWRQYVTYMDHGPDIPRTFPERQSWPDQNWTSLTSGNIMCLLDLPLPMTTMARTTFLWLAKLARWLSLGVVEHHGDTGWYWPTMTPLTFSAFPWPRPRLDCGVCWPDAFKNIGSSTQGGCQRKSLGNLKQYLSSLYQWGCSFTWSKASSSLSPQEALTELRAGFEAAPLHQIQRRGMTTLCPVLPAHG